MNIFRFGKKKEKKNDDNIKIINTVNNNNQLTPDNKSIHFNSGILKIF
jgi:hypothetical protein